MVAYSEFIYYFVCWAWDKKSSLSPLISLTAFCNIIPSFIERFSYSSSVIPVDILINAFAELYTRGIQDVEETLDFISLKKFWLKCCLNPNAQSAEDLYEFLTHHKVKIDRHGNFYAYRRVVSTARENKELVEFISNTYNKIKGVWKKKPSDYMVANKNG